ncbi:hypothetical protein JTB14_031622 [Gonioctena quinquepunctata]|nr:hypothetical protein JTB14_031622 [Gonioctena quinquepunctata]
MLRDSVEDPTESKFSPVYFWNNTECNAVYGFADGVTVKNENKDDFECAYNLSIDNAQLNNEAPEIEVDVIYEDIKPNICGNQVSSKCIGPEFGTSIDSGAGLQASTVVELDGTDAKRNNTVDSMIPSKKPLNLLSTIKHLREDNKLLRKYLLKAREEEGNTCYIKSNKLHVNEDVYQVSDLLALDMQSEVALKPNSAPSTPAPERQPESKQTQKPRKPSITSNNQSPTSARLQEKKSQK